MISAAGVAICPGDIVLANDDGVVVVPLGQSTGVLLAAHKHLAKEDNWIASLEAGKTIKELFGFPAPAILS